MANAPAECSSIEYSVVDPPSGQTCAQYFQDYIGFAGGALQNPNATSECQFCQITETNTFLTQVSSSYDHRYRNTGLLWVYIVFNAAGALFFYWLARVPKGTRATKKA